MKQKLIVVRGCDTNNLNELLNNGWVIKQISAASPFNCQEYLSVCYVWIEKQTESTEYHEPKIKNENSFKIDYNTF